MAVLEKMNSIYDVHNLFGRLTGKAKEDRVYCCMKNADGKEWLFDALSYSTIKNGLEIYAPVSVKGKMIKKALPFLHGVLCKLNILGFEKTAFSLNDELVRIVASVFLKKPSELHYNFFLGTPSVHQKIVVQIDDSKEVIGYVKFSNNPEIMKAFEREAELLGWLKGKGVNNVPTALYCNVPEGFSDVLMFIQSSQKKKKSFNDSAINESMLAFLEELYHKTKMTILFEESDFYTVLTDIYENAESYPLNREKLVAVADGLKEENRGKQVEYSVYHGDLTPWNSFYNRYSNKKNEFFAFDFEYAQKTFPPYLDIYHWFVSVCIFELHYKAEEVFTLFENEKTKWRKYDACPEKSMRMYLLSQISMYLNREKGQLSGQELESMRIWGMLLENYFG